MSRFAQKSLAIAAAAAFATATPLAFSPVTAPTALAQNTQGVDINRPATLTIDKRLGELGSAETLSGITFKVEQIELVNKLNTAAGWDEVSRIVEAGAATAKPTGAPTEKTTNGSGQAVFDGLSVGLYRVTELQNGNYTVAEPFLVTLPLMEDGTPNYNPTISPKNQLLEPKKSAQDTNVTVGKDIVYTIDAPVPAGDVTRDGQRTLKQFRIEDQLEDGLTYNTEAPARVTLTGAGSGALADGDYTVTAVGNKLVVDFTDQGLANLAALRASNPGLSVQVEFNATVTKIPASGQFNNTANVFIPNTDEPIKTTPKSDEDGEGNNVTTQFVNVKVTKTVDGNPDAAGGEGAQFEIFKCTDQAGKYVVVDGAEAVVGTNESGDAATGATLTAQAGAPAVASGYALQFDKSTEYCAVETKAPAGYLINPDPTPLVQQSPDAAGRPLYTTTINNVKDNLIGRLPATGERTMLALLAIGLVLFAGGAAYQLRRKNAEA